MADSLMWLIPATIGGLLGCVIGGWIDRRRHR